MFVCGCFFMELIEMKSDSSLLTGSVQKKLAAFALPLATPRFAGPIPTTR